MAIFKPENQEELAEVNLTAGELEAIIRLVELSWTAGTLGTRQMAELLMRVEDKAKEAHEKLRGEGSKPVSGSDLESAG